MPEKSRKVLNAYWIAAILLTLLFVVARTVITLTYLDTEKELYPADCLPVTVLHIAIAAVTVFLCTAAFAVQKGSRIDPYADSAPASSMLTVFSAILSAFTLVVSLILSAPMLLQTVQGPTAQQALYSTATLNEFSNVQRVFSVLLCVSIIPSAIYFFCVSSMRRQKNSVLALLSMCVVLYHAFLIVSTYFDISVAVNSPVKLFNHIALIFSMLFFLGEARYYIGMVQPRVYLFFAYPALFLTALSAVPDFIVNLQKAGGGLSVSMIQCAVQIAFSLYILSRLRGFSRVREHAQNEISDDSLPTAPENSAPDESAHLQQSEVPEDAESSDTEPDFDTPDSEV